MSGQSEAEKKGYKRGYQRGVARMENYVARAFRFAKAYRSTLRATQAEKFGRDNWLSRECRTCERWKRGEPGDVRWGLCGRDFLAVVGEPSMWAPESGEIYTHENFGCCNHLSNNPMRPPNVSPELWQRTLRGPQCAPASQPSQDA